MTTKFTTLDKTKQKRITDAAMREFAQYAYDQASTNRIVQEAGIGKGMLFHYFGSKEALYAYLAKRAITVLEELYTQYIDMDESDFIERMKGSAKLKMEVYQRYPDLFNFIAQTVLEKESKLPKPLADRLDTMQQDGMRRLFSGLDTTLFRDEVPGEDVLKLISWSIDGYSQELLAKLNGAAFTEIDLEPHWQQFYEFLDVLKRVYYK
ncbi:TetR/AcrR family transcriptional regulator [Sporosarcina trichiuri]|uniref:TetR/AcrR family transcriptional regulator n=1 Tax=Sporosarcina trichiuri TaxID=3056445 RepID=UPI0025B2B4AB|nr:TetR/AcrR family transcriptional regulator [Sporosarcina sp. 0.2-SM1T-5]WJY26105.1 TetR/AcrR family transcriptional regulator [Sporosarcina sp. 0.2-SM1T-5]